MFSSFSFNRFASLCFSHFHKGVDALSVRFGCLMALFIPLSLSLLKLYLLFISTLFVKILTAKYETMSHSRTFVPIHLVVFSFLVRKKKKIYWRMVQCDVLWQRWVGINSIHDIYRNRQSFKNFIFTFICLSIRNILLLLFHLLFLFSLLQ